MKSAVLALLAAAWMGISAPLQTTRVPVPAFPGAYALWGSTGQDSRGHIWFGVSAERVPVPSAHLFEYIPGSAAPIDRGNVVDELKRAGVWRPGEHQAKIHSRIVQGPDGYLYFSSMDEEGEHEDGSRLPTWGGHLWRLRLTTNRWEHLRATPEALIAVAGGDRFVFALGYFGHVLYRYDTTTGEIKRAGVGSIDGHISRNLFADGRGHVYVPRLGARDAGNGRRAVDVGIVEYGSDFRQLRETPIDPAEYFSNDNPTESNGITGVEAMADGSTFFVTHVGYLLRAVPPSRMAGRPVDDAPARIAGVGWMHPAGTMFVTSLFASPDARALYGLARRDLMHFDWLTCDATGAQCSAAPIALPPLAPGVNQLLLYGSSTRDDRNGHYVVGTTFVDSHMSPIILRVQP